MKTINTLVITLLTISLFGCAGFNKKLKNLFGNKTQQTAQKTRRPKMSYSKNSNYQSNLNRSYKRTTKKKLKEEADLTQRSGSLWVMEGQGAYLFSQNIVRLIGDPMRVQINGEPKQQLETKVDVIKKLLKRIATRNRLAKREASQKEKEKSSKKAVKKPKTKDRKVASKTDGAEPESKFGVKYVQTRIVERMVDGNYRVKGSQPFMIGRREYKVILTGIVRSDDFSEDGVPAAKLLDSKFDIVSVRKGRTRL